MYIVAEIWKQSGLKQDTVVTKLIFKFISQALETLFLRNGSVMIYTRSQTSSLFIQNVNNLFDSADFWFREISPLLSKTMHALTGASVTKCAVSM